MASEINDAKRRELYQARLNLPGDKHPKSAKAALDRAHDLRRFEIENYWRRSTYFWGFQLAAIAALAIARQSGILDYTILMIVSILGMVTAYTGVLTAQGSKFWQENWEHHVDLLEEEVEGRLHQTALTRGGVRAPSVSRANERLLILIMQGWVLTFLVAAWFRAAIVCGGPVDWRKVVEISGLAVVAAYAMSKMSETPRSALPGRLYDVDTMDSL